MSHTRLLSRTYSHTSCVSGGGGLSLLRSQAAGLLLRWRGGRVGAWGVVGAIQGMLCGLHDLTCLWSWRGSRPLTQGSKTRKMKKGDRGGRVSPLNKGFCFDHSRNVSSIKRCLQRERETERGGKKEEVERERSIYLSIPSLIQSCFISFPHTQRRHTVLFGQLWSNSPDYKPSGVQTVTNALNQVLYSGGRLWFSTLPPPS